MDAKPVRGFRIHDENAVPLAQNKTLHSRNKSTPALSTLAAKGAFKMAAKRSVFGDISQTARGNRPFAEINTNAKDLKMQEEKKVVNLQQPAQKPNGAFNFAVVQPLQETDVNSQVKKVLSKRATTIFRDYSTLPQTVQRKETQVPETKVIVKKTEQEHAVAEQSQPIKAQEASKPANLSHTTIIPAFDDLHIPSAQAVETVPAIEVSAAVQSKEELNEESKKENKVENKEENKIVSTYVLQEKTADETKLLAAIHAAAAGPQRYIEPEEFARKYASRTLHSIVQPQDEPSPEVELEDDRYVTANSYPVKQELDLVLSVDAIPRPVFDSCTLVELEAAAAIVKHLKEPADIEDEEWDISMVAEYKEDIFEYYREVETRMQPNVHYMDIQTEIDWQMRSILIDWVVQVHDRFQLLPETLYLAINVIDRFLSVKVVSIGKLQLVGATALFVAAKYEEVNPPNLKEMEFMVDKNYDEEEIMKAERFMLTLLGFELGWPGPMSFLRRISTADDYDLETRTTAKYFLELTIMDERFLCCKPSFLSAGAHCLARQMLNKGHWGSAHVHYSGYTYVQLYPLMINIMECLVNPTKHHNAIYEKYCKHKYSGAASFAKEEMSLGFQLIDPYCNLVYNFDNLYHLNLIHEYTCRQVQGYVSPPFAPL